MPGEISILLDELHECQSKLTAARDEAERLRVQLSDITGCACDAGSLCKYHAMTTASGRSVVLRKQAEALDSARSYLIYRFPMKGFVLMMHDYLASEAQRLRQQAQSIERGE